MFNFYIPLVRYVVFFFFFFFFTNPWILKQKSKFLYKGNVQNGNKEKSTFTLKYIGINRYKKPLNVFQWPSTIWTGTSRYTGRYTCVFTLIEFTSSRRPAKTHIHLRSPLQVSCNGLMVWNGQVRQTQAESIRSLCTFQYTYLSVYFYHIIYCPCLDYKWAIYVGYLRYVILKSLHVSHANWFHWPTEISTCIHAFEGSL